MNPAATRLVKLYAELQECPANEQAARKAAFDNAVQTFAFEYKAPVKDVRIMVHKKHFEERLSESRRVKRLPDVS